MKITVSSKGLDAIQKQITSMKERVEQSLKVGVDAGTMLLQESAQNKVSVKTGNLKRNIQRKVESDSGKVKGTVYVDLGGAPYGAEVEYGSMGLPEGVILPKKGKFLAFEINGKKVFTKAVYQPGKPFMRPAFDQDGQAAIQKVKEIVTEGLKG